MKHIFLITSVLAMSAAMPAQARTTAGSQPELVIGSVSEDAASFLSDDTLSISEADALLERVNVEAVSRFALGRYVRTASEADLTAYNEAFRSYLTSQMQTHLDKFAGGQFEIINTVEREPGDVVVETRVTTTDGDNLPVSWRVKSFDGTWQIIDIEFEGLWLIIEQRAQFQATLDANGGDVGALAAGLS